MVQIIHTLPEKNKLKTKLNPRKKQPRKSIQYLSRHKVFGVTRIDLCPWVQNKPLKVNLNSLICFYSYESSWHVSFYFRIFPVPSFDTMDISLFFYLSVRHPTCNSLTFESELFWGREKIHHQPPPSKTIKLRPFSKQSNYFH